MYARVLGAPLAALILLAGAATASAAVGNGKLAFDSDRGTSNDVWVVDPSDPTDIENLTGDSDASDFEPKWSPDGTKIAFKSGRDGDYGLYVMGFDGSGVTRLGQLSSDGTFVWSPDSAKIAYVGIVDLDREILVVDGEGAESPVNVTSDSNAEDRDPAWSPDGTQLVFAKESQTDPTQSDLYLSEPSEGDIPEPFTSSATTNESDPAWSPDGTSIAYAAVGESVDDIYVKDVSDRGPSVPRNLTQSAGTESAPAWSPDGTQVAYLSYILGASSVNVAVADGQTAPVTLAGWGTAESDAPVWAPDGTQVAYGGTVRGNQEIFTVSVDGSEATNVTDHGAADSAPNWQQITVADPEPPVEGGAESPPSGSSESGSGSSSTGESSSGGTQTGSSTEDTTAPTIKLRKRLQMRRLRSNRRASVRVHLSEAAELRVRLKRGSRVVARASGSIGAEGEAAIALRLGRKHRSGSTRSKGRLVLEVEATDAAGNRKVKRYRVT